MLLGLSKWRRPQVLVVGGVLLAAVLASSAFAANILTPGASAGQGVITVEGYRVANLLYDGVWSDPESTDATTLVETVSFSLEAEADQPGQSSVTGDNTAVYVQLRAEDGSANWARCTVAIGGLVSCTLDERQELLLADVTGVSIVAYSSTSP